MCIHGDKSQPERDWVLNGTVYCESLLACSMKQYMTLLYMFTKLEFRSGNAPILIATDVASRGLGK